MLFFWYLMYNQKFPSIFSSEIGHHLCHFLLVISHHFQLGISQRFGQPFLRCTPDRWVRWPARAFPLQGICFVGKFANLQMLVSMLECNHLVLSVWPGLSEDITRSPSSQAAVERLGCCCATAVWGKLKPCALWVLVTHRSKEQCMPRVVSFLCLY